VLSLRFASCCLSVDYTIVSDGSAKLQDVSSPAVGPLGVMHRCLEISNDLAFERISREMQERAERNGVSEVCFVYLQQHRDLMGYGDSSGVRRCVPSCLPAFCFAHRMVLMRAQPVMPYHPTIPAMTREPASDSSGGKAGLGQLVVEQAVEAAQVCACSSSVDGVPSC
jgi:hypothetical protein